MAYENYMNQNALDKQSKDNESTGGQDLTKYFNFRPTMKDGGNTMKVTMIRLLPSKSDPSTPFEYVHMHAFKVGDDFRTYICPAKNGLGQPGEACPLCELSKGFFDARDKAATPQLKEDFGKRGGAYMSKGYWYARGIERGKESEGIKWWRFPDQSYKHDGIKDDLDKLNASKREILRAQGLLANPDWTMYDLNDGYDLVVTCAGTVKDNKNNFTYSISTVDQRSSLHPDFTVGNAWINDPATYYTVYKVQPFAYLEIVALGGEPRFSKEEQRYYDYSGKVDTTKYPQYMKPVNYEQVQEQKNQQQGGQYVAATGYYQQQGQPQGGGYYQQAAAPQQQAQGGYYQPQPQQQMYGQQQAQQPVYAQQQPQAQQPVYAQQQPTAQTQGYQPQQPMYAQQPVQEQQAPAQQPQAPVYAQQQPQQPVYAQQPMAPQQPQAPAMAAPAMEVNQAEAEKLPF